MTRSNAQKLGIRAVSVLFTQDPEGEALTLNANVALSEEWSALRIRDAR